MDVQFDLHLQLVLRTASLPEVTFWHISYVVNKSLASAHLFYDSVCILHCTYLYLLRPYRASPLNLPLLGLAASQYVVEIYWL